MPRAPRLDPDVALCDKAVGMLRNLEDSANPGIVRRVMSLFLDATPELLDALREASITRNVETLRVASSHVEVVQRVDRRARAVGALCEPGDAGA